MKRRLKIGEVARLASIKIDTVRFYEKVGLLPEPPRLESGYRVYPLNTVERLRFIRNAKELGFTLEEIKELLSLRVSRDTPCAQVQQTAHEKMDDIERRICQLKKMKKALKRLAATCDTSKVECPLLESLGTFHRTLEATEFLVFDERQSD